MRGDLPPIGRLRGTAPGPTLALLAGIHGDELEGVLAVGTLLAELADADLQGELVWAAPAHPAAWAADSRTSPVDGQNLARVFPGDPGGTPTEQVAAHLTAELITGADLLIDLHSAGRGFDMPLLAGYRSTGNLSTRSEAAARAFAAPLLWQHPASSGGRSLSAAEQLGIPSFYVEGRGGGRLRERDLAAYVHGVLRVMVHLGMVDASALSLPSPPETRVVRGDGNTDEGITAPVGGYFVTAAEVGDVLAAGAEIGTVRDQDGAVRTRLVAADGGIVMLLRRDARVHAGDTLAIVADIETAAGTEIDAEPTPESTPESDTKCAAGSRDSTEQTR